MTIDYGSSAGGVFGRPRAVTLVGTNPVTLTSQSIALTASSSVGTGASVTRLVGLTNASQSIKATAGRLFGAIFVNPGAAAVYVNIYNATAPTIGTTQPTLQVLVPAGQSFDFENIPGIAFGTAITVAATDVSSPLSAVAPATTVQANIFWI